MDKLEVEILADGSLKVTSGKVSMANHANAEAFLRELAKGCGGETIRARRYDVAVSLAGKLADHCADGHTHDNADHIHN